MGILSVTISIAFFVALIANGYKPILHTQYTLAYNDRQDGDGMKHKLEKLILSRTTQHCIVVFPIRLSSLLAMNRNENVQRLCSK